MGSVQPRPTATTRPGVLTKSIVRSPVCKLILHARVRHRDFNDVVFVGENFIHVKQVKHNGHLEHIATKDDFGARIKTARTFNLDAEPSEDDEDFIKREQTEDAGPHAQHPKPPQLVVLALDSDEMIFLYLEDNGTGRPKFRHQMLPLPRFEEPIHKLGVHLAVDPHSRAVAMAASEEKIIVFAGRATDQIQEQIGSGHPDWFPVDLERSFTVHGVIQHVEFLHPPDKDPDHIILLVIAIENRKTKAIWIDWYGNSDLGRAQTHPSQTIDTAKTVPSLLVPLREASFLLITGNEMKLQKDILSGSMRSVVLRPGDELPSYPGSSARKPVWTSWCKPRRNKSASQGQDIIHLVRENGLVMLATITGIDTIQTSHAGDVSCHVGTAFASLGDPSDPDILAVVGDMSSGRVVHMGSWPSTGVIPARTRVDTMAMEESEILSNWASCADMVVSNLPHSANRSARTTDAVFVTSGRQPYGSVTELRKGYEARLATWFEVEGLKNAVGAWVLPNISTGSILLLLSSPSSTRLLDINPDLEGLSELDETETTAMVLSERTIVADALGNGHLLQVSERAICTSASIMASFEDRSRWDANSGHTIIAASIEPTHNCVFIIVRSGKSSRLLAFKHRAQSADDEDEEDTDDLQQLFEPEALEEEPICLATNVVGDNIIGVSSTVEGRLQVFRLDMARSSPKFTLFDSLQIVEDQQSLCDNIVLLRSTSADSASRHLVAVCGLRDGRVIAVTIDTASSPMLGQVQSINFGHETVRLHRQTGEPDKTYAFSGLDTCIITWDGPSADSLNIQNLWMSDMARLDMAQSAITTISSVPSSDYLSGTELIGSLANSLVVISSNEVCFASVDQATTIVPRQIPVSGTPTRLIYAEQQRNLVCASVSYDVRSFPSNKRGAQPEIRRQIWPVIDFIPTDKEFEPYRFDLQPGETVNALLEWSFQQSGKRYCFVMVGGSYTKHKQTVKGRIAFLQPSYRNWQIDNVKEGRSVTFDHPVYALALYDELTYIVCSGSSVSLSRFDTAERKWENMCAPIKLSSKGLAISVACPFIHVSTAEDSLVTLRLEKLPSQAEDADYTHCLSFVAQSPRIDSSLSHTIVPLGDESNLALLSTRDNLLLGLTSPPPKSLNRHRTRILFEAALPQSLVRISQGNTRPLWRRAPPNGVLASNIVGLSTDGSMTGISLLDDSLWRRLFWLQRVLEWSKDFSPHLVSHPIYAVTDDTCRGRERGLPIGFGDDATDEIALFSAEDIGAEADRHVDGDILAKVLDFDGVERLKAALREMARRQDRIGQWVTRHLDEEIQAVEGIVGEVGVLVDLWM
ncbi:hypothetical protein Q7P37_000106 [Cladosporium fusiforme]